MAVETKIKMEMKVRQEGPWRGDCVVGGVLVAIALLVGNSNRLI